MMNVSGSQFHGILKLYGEQTKVNRTMKTGVAAAAKPSDSVVRGHDVRDVPAPRCLRVHHDHEPGLCGDIRHDLQ